LTGKDSLILSGDSMRLSEARPFRLSMLPTGFTATMPLRLTRHRFRSSGARIMVGLFLGQFGIVDQTAGGEF
jgi:hypothetical protein